MKPTISLIIPAYNEEKYLGECLDYAIKNSGGRFLEIIVIDNASTDRTREVALARPGVRVAREERKGLTKARERGRLEAKGDILAYIDADTHMPETWLTTLEAAFASNPKVVCVSGPYTYYDISPFQKFLVKLYWLFVGVPMYTLTGFMVVGGNFAITKTALEKMEGFDTTISFYGEDTNIARRASEHGKVKFTLKLVMPTSGRRFKGQGLWTTAFTYMINFASEAFFHRAATAEYKDIR